MTWFKKVTDVVAKGYNRVCAVEELVDNYVTRAEVKVLGRTCDEVVSATPDAVKRVTVKDSCVTAAKKVVSTPSVMKDSTKKACGAVGSAGKAVVSVPRAAGQRVCGVVRRAKDKVVDVNERISVTCTWKTYVLYFLVGGVCGALSNVTGLVWGLGTLVTFMVVDGYRRYNSFTEKDLQDAVASVFAVYTPTV